MHLRHFQGAAILYAAERFPQKLGHSKSVTTTAFPRTAFGGVQEIGQQDLHDL
jgi:hypothetical protein